MKIIGDTFFGIPLRKKKPQAEFIKPEAKPSAEVRSTKELLQHLQSILIAKKRLVSGQGNADEHRALIRDLRWKLHLQGVAVPKDIVQLEAVLERGKKKGSI